MTQTSTHKQETIGIAAAAAATNGHGNGTNDVTETHKKTRQRRKKVFVVIGTVYEFESRASAEKFLNSDEAPEGGEYTVIQGTQTKMSQRVSLR